MASAPGGRGRRDERARHPPALKRYGQHFLSDRAILTAIVDALSPAAADTVVEVGPGRGSLTEILAERTGRLIAVEIDRALSAELRNRFAAAKNVEIIEGDFLETEIGALVGEDYLLIGNVPYYITTPIIFKALDPPMPRRAVFLVQREVAERMSAAAASESYGALSVNVGAVAEVEKVLDVPASAFRPPPKVESAVVRITPKGRPLVSPESLPAFRAFVQAAFGHRRKQMLRVLRNVRGFSAADAGNVLERVGIANSDRPEVITVQQFAALFTAIRNGHPD